MNTENYLLVPEVVEVVINIAMCGISKLGNTWKAIETSLFYSKIILNIFPASQLPLRASHPGDENNSDVMPSNVYD